MKIYIVQCDDKVSSLGYSTIQEALSFVNERVINALSNGYDCVWLCNDKNISVIKEK